MNLVELAKQNHEAMHSNVTVIEDVMFKLLPGAKMVVWSDSFNEGTPLNFKRVSNGSWRVPNLRKVKLDVNVLAVLERAYNQIKHQMKVTEDGKQESNSSFPGVEIESETSADQTDLQ